jgi:isopentenyl-diphosphate delta-isomerase
MDVAWVTLDDLARRVKDDPAKFTPWLRIYLSEGRAELGSSLAQPDHAHV